MSKLITIGKPKNIRETLMLVKELQTVLADLERDLNRYLLRVPSGQLGGTYVAPTILGIRETGGPTLLTFGAIPDTFKLARSGSTIVGVP